MKKNKIMRLASVLLIAVLLSTSIISGTFAKYVTSNEVTDTARVAKFGVTIEGKGSMFSKTYFSKDRGNTPNSQFVNDNGKIGVLTVESSNEDKVVAPGTKSTDDGLVINLHGKPEVDVLITFEINDASEDIFLVGGEYRDVTKNAFVQENGYLNSGKKFEFSGTYYPIVYTLSGELVKQNSGLIYDLVKTGDLQTNATASLGYTDEYVTSVSGNLDVIKAVLATINSTEMKVPTGNSNTEAVKKGIYVEANTDLSTVLGANADRDLLKLTWEWAFEEASTERVTGDNATKTIGDSAKVGLVDQMDTLLGDLAAAGSRTGADDAEYNYVLNAAGDGKVSEDAYNLDVNVTLTVTVTQVD